MFWNSLLFTDDLKLTFFIYCILRLPFIQTLVYSTWIKTLTCQTAVYTHPVITVADMGKMIDRLSCLTIKNGEINNPNTNTTKITAVGFPVISLEGLCLVCCHMAQSKNNMQPHWTAAVGKCHIYSDTHSALLSFRLWDCSVNEFGVGQTWH